MSNPLPDGDEFSVDLSDSVKRILRKTRASEVRLEVAKVMIPVLGAPRVSNGGLEATLDWWVNWITGELEE